VQQLRSKRRRNPELWHKANRLVATLIVAGSVAGAVVLFYPEWIRHAALAEQLEEERAKLRAEELLREQRTREVDLLQNDPEYVEIIARDKIGVMKEGETIFRLDAAPPAAGGAH
jgi:cell division protein FtsB